MKRIYLDYAASTPVDPRVFDAMKPYFSKKFGNVSSLHKEGQEAKRALGESRGKIAEFINADGNEIIFTSSGTESDNFAVKGVAFANQDKGKHIITSSIEHPAVLKACGWLERQGFDITHLPVDQYGLVNPAAVEDAIRKDTILVSIMHANNEIGTIEPVEEIGKICREHNVIFHTDAVQTFGKIPIDVETMNIDLLTASSHKLYGPKGVGMLYKRNGIKLEPLLHGGGQEIGVRSSTENVAGIVGFAAAVELRRKEMESESRKLTQLRNHLIKNVLKIEDSHLNGHPIKRLQNNASFWFNYIEGESLVTHLNYRGIAASTGSACSSTSLKPSHVLLAIGLKHNEIHGSLRLTSGKYTTKHDIDYVIKTLPQVVERLREMSPFKGGWK